MNTSQKQLVNFEWDYYAENFAKLREHIENSKVILFSCEYMLSAQYIEIFGGKANLKEAIINFMIQDHYGCLEDFDDFTLEYARDDYKDHWIMAVYNETKVGLAFMVEGGDYLAEIIEDILNEQPVRRKEEARVVQLFKFKPIA